MVVEEGVGVGGGVLGGGVVGGAVLAGAVGDGDRFGEGDFELAGAGDVRDGPGDEPAGSTTAGLRPAKGRCRPPGRR
jgi:hypothetical protein